ncbi:hypothetical protein [Micromonospora sp. LOL_023]|uniref:hypothetical protein n=1 Tax=Micromonospora sp. LOL_023 TaxID=3345418 RepID=UPI003A854A46
MVSLVPHTPDAVPDFARWPSFPFDGDLRVKQLDDPVDVEPPRKGEGTAECSSCSAPDDAYIWVSERWRVRAMDRPTGLPMVLILESRSHFDLGDLPNLLAAELGVMTVRLERAVRSLDGVARVHVNRWGDGSAHLHLWFLARPYGQLQLRGTFLSLWDSILPPITESRWRENLALVAAWLAEFGGRQLAEPPRIEWRTPSNLLEQASHPFDADREFGVELDADGRAAGDGPAAVLPIESIEPAADLDELVASPDSADPEDAVPGSSRADAVPAGVDASASEPEHTGAAVTSSEDDQPGGELDDEASDCAEQAVGTEAAGTGMSRRSAQPETVPAASGSARGGPTAGAATGSAASRGPSDQGRK